jgi:hypothetical protein
LVVLEQLTVVLVQVSSVSAQAVSSRQAAAVPRIANRLAMEAFDFTTSFNAPNRHT